MTAKKTLYRVTEKAGPRVNGQRVRPGDELKLTEAEAMYERDLGHIEEVPKEAPAESAFQPLNLTDEERAVLPALDTDLPDVPENREFGTMKADEQAEAPSSSKRRK
jgi:hypothetical protein